MKRQNMINLLIKFYKVKEQGFVPSLRKGPTGLGYTFETMIGKAEENLPIPDFDDIEIKVKKQFGNGTLSFFNATPDNEVMAAKRIYDQYGIFNRNFRFNKTFIVTVDSIKQKKYGKHYFCLKVDYNNERIVLEVRDENMVVIDDEISWSFDLIREKIKYKIQNLAIVKAQEKIIQKVHYYYYYHIYFYEIKGVDYFINLIEKGIINITFKMSTYMDGPKYGEMYNHGIGFNINISDIEELYNKINFEKKTTNSRI